MYARLSGVLIRIMWSLLLYAAQPPPSPPPPAPAPARATDLHYLNLKFAMSSQNLPKRKQSFEFDNNVGGVNPGGYCPTKGPGFGPCEQEKSAA